MKRPKNGCWADTGGTGWDMSDLIIHATLESPSEQCTCDDPILAETPLGTVCLKRFVAAVCDAIRDPLVRLGWDVGYDLGYNHSRIVLQELGHEGACDDLFGERVFSLKKLRQAWGAGRYATEPRKPEPKKAP